MEVTSSDVIVEIIASKNHYFNQLVDLFDAYRVFYKQESDLSAASSFLSRMIEQQKSIIITAKVKEVIAGFTQLYPCMSSVSMAELYVLNDLYVDQKYRGCGIGGTLIKAAQQVAADRSWKGMVLETARDNPAQLLYRRTGWQIDENTLHFYWNTPKK